MPSGLERLTIDFVNMTMNTTLANDKLSLPHMVEIKNAELEQTGTFRKRRGSELFNSGGQPLESSSSTINFISPIAPNLNDTTNNYLAISDDTPYTTSSGTWTVSGAGALTGADVYPWRSAFGVGPASGNNRLSALYYANIASGVYRAVSGTPATKLGGATWDKADAVEAHLDKLFVGNVIDSSPTLYRYDRIRWCATGDDTDWTGAGAGFLDLRIDGGASNTASLAYARRITGLRVYHNRLYIATQVSLHRLTGTTSSTFGVDFLRPQNYVNGSTMWVTGDILWYVDRDGIWAFNGSIARNVVHGMMRDKWQVLDSEDDIDVATATFDDRQGLYIVYFRATAEAWVYHYRTGQWDIYDMSDGYDVNVISYPLLSADIDEPDFMLGTQATGKIYHFSDSLSQDDGNAITASFTTGHLPIAGQGNRFELQWMDLYAARQATAGTITNTITIDGVNVQTAASADPTFTVTATGGSAETFPQRFVMNTLPVQRQGEYLQMKLTDATDAHRCDLRRMDIWYKVLPGRKP